MSDFQYDISVVLKALGLKETSKEAQNLLGNLNQLSGVKLKNITSMTTGQEKPFMTYNLAIRDAIAHKKALNAMSGLKEDPSRMFRMTIDPKPFEQEQQRIQKEKQQLEKIRQMKEDMYKKLFIQAENKTAKEIELAQKERQAKENMYRGMFAIIDQQERKAAEKSRQRSEKKLEQDRVNTRKQQITYTNMFKKIEADQERSINKMVSHGLKLVKFNQDSEFNIFKAKLKTKNITDQLAGASARLGTQDATTQSKIRVAISNSNAALQQATSLYQRYSEARIRGDEQAARMHRHEAEVFVSTARSAANEATRLANRQIRGNQQVSSSYRGLTQSVQGLYHQMRTLNHAFYAFGGYLAINTLKRVDGYFVNAGRSALKYADNVNKAQLSMTALGIVKTGKSEEQIDTFGNTEDKKTLTRARKFSKEMHALLQDEAAKTGQDFNEVYGVVKTLLPDMMNKFKGKGNYLLEHGEEVKGLTKDYVELLSALKMVDPRGGDLFYQAFPIQKMLTGSGKEDGENAAQNFRSALNRLNIRVLEKDQKLITKYATQGKMRQAMDEVMRIMKASGVSAATLGTMMSKTMEPNVAGTISSLMRIRNVITGPTYGAFTEFFKTVNRGFREIMMNDGFNKHLEKVGKSIKEFILKDLHIFTRMMDRFDANGMSGWKKLIDGAAEFGKAIWNINVNILEFFAGLFGISKNTSIEGYTKDLKTLNVELVKSRDAARELGNKFHTAFSWIQKIVDLVGIETLTGAIVGGAVTGGNPFGIVGGAAIGGAVKRSNQDEEMLKKGDWLDKLKWHIENMFTPSLMPRVTPYGEKKNEQKTNNAKKENKGTTISIGSITINEQKNAKQFVDGLNGYGVA